MIKKVKLRKVGNSVGLLLPKEVLTTLKCSEGDSVYLTDSAEGGVLLSPADPSFAEQVEIAGKIMKRYRNTLRELAK